MRGILKRRELWLISCLPKIVSAKRELEVHKEHLKYCEYMAGEEGYSPRPLIQINRSYVDPRTTNSKGGERGKKGFELG
jgi:hypothetical protein